MENQKNEAKTNTAKNSEGTQYNAYIFWGAAAFAVIFTLLYSISAGL